MLLIKLFVVYAVALFAAVFVAAVAVLAPVVVDLTKKKNKIKNKKNCH